MDTSPAAHPLEAATLPELLRLQIAHEHPTGTIASVARYIGIKEPTLYSWCADIGAAGSRIPEPATIKDVLRQLNAAPEVVEHALRLWAAAKGAA